MTIEELSSAAPPPAAYEKAPPQDVAAEQCVLGGMMLSKDAIADVVEILRVGDFYRPVHATVFNAILDLYGRGEPADAITVAAALESAGELGRVGGGPYLHTLISAVPTAANASYYARIVSERAVLRRLVEAGTKIVQLGYGNGAGHDVDDIVDLAQQAIYDVTEKRVSEDFAILADMLQPTLDEIEAVGAQGGLMTGVPTGFTDLDRLLNGLQSGQLIVVAGRPGLGKALALHTPLPTPTGWTTMGQVRAGDLLLGADGKPTKVLHAFEVMHGRPCYEVHFSDGSTIVADAEHLWKTSTRAGHRHALNGAHQWSAAANDRAEALAFAGQRFRNFLAAVKVGSDGEGVAEGGQRRRVPAYSRRALMTARRRRVTHDQVVTTAHLASTLHGVGRPKHAVATCDPLRLPAARLPVPPHALGVWLRDEASAAALRAMGIDADTRIPSSYLRASEQQRRSLLAGLLGLDGTAAPTGDVRFTSADRSLAEDVFELLVSLGYRCSLTAEGAPHTVVARTGSRYITAVKPVPSVPVRCVTVDNADHLYLAGRSMIPTHNSTVSMDFARHAAVRHNLASAIFSLEMSKVEIVMRLLSAEARVPLNVLRSGQLSDDDWTKLARRMGEISEAPIFVDDTPNMNLMEIRAKARRLKQRHDLKLIVVDYLQLMTSPKRTESRQQEVADLSRGLKLLAKEVECPVIAVSQLNRGPEQRTDKRPQLSDLRESGSIEQDADVVILLHRDDYYDKESPRAGEADFIVAKHRNGPTDTITVAAQLHLSRFVDMAIG